ncbi:type II secretion system F family protein [Ornithinimicrobium sp. INDO-MA30-4]|uniref:type II secretion system F family protein n=1 Tax=Ornithinimicrobium sp. INDO-MA30-4 TaxID=2908651 RepID=UPI001F3F8EF5|nr:type II secretion system F family protein [Ornithinimicrobium sp. INDO-MA30-4]UJH71773.1 type II secretion system F family protein [Ornithinimicrobium sp. INDO-MA30-4]
MAPRVSRRSQILLLVGFALGLIIAVTTGWVIAVILAPAAVAGIPMLFAAPPAGREVKRLEAMEEWVRSLSGVLTSGAGLEQALASSLRSTPELIRPEVTRLVGRLRGRWNTETALKAFADDLDDPTGDLIAATLVLGARKRGAGLGAVLDGLAESVASDVRARREVEADRAKPRSNARLITIITVIVLGLLGLSGDYVAPYGTPFGQVLLVLLLTLYVATLLWMRKMAEGKPLPRMIGSAARQSAL